MIAAANLRAQLYGIKGSMDRAALVHELASVTVPVFVTRSDVKFDTDDKAAQEAANQRKKESWGSGEGGG